MRCVRVHAGEVEANERTADEPNQTAKGDVSDRKILLFLLLFRILRRRLLRRCVLGATLLVYFLEKTERGLLSLTDLLPDLISSHRSIAGETLRGQCTKLLDKFGDLVLLGGVELILELIHRCESGFSGN